MKPNIKYVVFDNFGGWVFHNNLEDAEADFEQCRVEDPDSLIMKVQVLENLTNDYNDN